MLKTCFAAAAAALIVSSGAVEAHAQNLLTNGDFEDSTSQTQTPPGWTNVGHSEGVIAYSAFNTPNYNGAYYYDLGGYGDAFGPVGDGIEQAVATAVGSTYTLTFGLSSENNINAGRLDVYIGSLLTSFDLTQDTRYGVLAKPFVTQTINYTATGNSTLIRFLIGATSNGNNDPMIDGVSFVATSAGVPEPATWALMILGFGAVGGAMRRRRSVTAKVRVA